MYDFTGFLGNEKLNINNKNLVDLMTNSIIQEDSKHNKIYYDENIFINIRNLNPMNSKDNVQPFSYDNGNYYLAFNGKIYNHIELRSKLISKGIKFKTNTKFETILALYKYYGKDFVKELRGMFSFIIWDKKNKTLFAARDPFGIKQFYYLNTNKGLYFTSEPTNLLSNPNISNLSINKISLQNYLTFQYVPEPDTIIEDCYTLDAGSTLEKRLGKDNISINKYWVPKFKPLNNKKHEKIYEIRKCLKDSVADNMKDNIPIGSFLSGGIDSSIIVTLAKEINPDIKTFTAGFDVQGYNEIDFAKEIAYELNVENISKTITPEEFVEELPNIIWHMNVPVADPSAIPIYFISKEARKHVPAILSGEGSDELFGGYNIYREPNSLNIFSYIPEPIKDKLLSIANILPEGVKGKGFITRGCTPIEKRYVGNARIFNEEEKMSIINNYNSKYSYDKVTKPYFDQAADYDDITKMQYVDINTWLKGDILVKSYRMTKAHSLELRVPFLDKKVFNIASKLTLEEKIKGKTTKYLLRKAFSDILPKSVLKRKKLGYPVPIKYWLKDEIYDWAVNTIKESNTEEYINKAEVLKLLEEHRKGPLDKSRKIWTILTFMIWHKVFVEKNNISSSYVS